jgi:hypothetical protein
MPPEVLIFLPLASLVIRFLWPKPQRLEIKNAAGLFCGEGWWASLLAFIRSSSDPEA